MLGWELLERRAGRLGPGVLNKMAVAKLGEGATLRWFERPGGYVAKIHGTRVGVGKTTERAMRAGLAYIDKHGRPAKPKVLTHC
jgi:hypothetical protein